MAEVAVVVAPAFALAERLKYSLKLPPDCSFEVLLDTDTNLGKNSHPPLAYIGEVKTERRKLKQNNLNEYRRQNLDRLLASPLGVHREARLAAGTTPRSVAPVGALPSVSKLRK